MATNMIIIGAAGRMGKLLIKNVIESEDLNLVGAIEHKESPCIGQDAGNAAGIAESGINIKSDLSEIINEAHAIIDFSTGPVAENAEIGVKSNVPVVIGTTALEDDSIKKLEDLGNKGGKIVLAPNMSIGVNLLFYLTKEVSKILNNKYEIEIVEAHHNKKKDAPSGTAAKLANIAAQARNFNIDKAARYGRKGLTGSREEEEIGIHALRGGDIAGEHTIHYAAEGERIELTHKATRRDTFALGALDAARFLINKAEPGMYDMQDILGLK